MYMYTYIYIFIMSDANCIFHYVSKFIYLTRAVLFESCTFSQVSYSMIENAEGCVTLSFDNVPKSKLKDIKDRWAFDIRVKKIVVS